MPVPGPLERRPECGLPCTRPPPRRLQDGKRGRRGSSFPTTLARRSSHCTNFRAPIKGVTPRSWACQRCRYRGQFSSNKRRNQVTVWFEVRTGDRLLPSENACARTIRLTQRAAVLTASVPDDNCSRRISIRCNSSGSSNHSSARRTDALIATITESVGSLNCCGEIRAVPRIRRCVPPARHDLPR